MKRSILLIVLLSCLALGGSAEAVVVHFDDLAGNDLLVPDGYGGITWDENWVYYGYDQPPYTPASPANRVYNNYAEYPAGSVQAVPFYFGSPVVFSGAFFSGYDFNPIYFDLYLASVLVGTSGALVPTDVPAFLASGYGGLVDEVRVVGNAYRVMDDVTYDAAAVPEPGTLLLMGSALLGLPAARARRRKK